MMKQVLLSTLFALLISTFSFAQVVIDSTNLGDVGEWTVEGTDTLSVINIGSAGTGQVWDYSTLAEHYIDTINYKVPDSIPGGTQYPTANLGVQVDDSNFFYTEKTSSYLTVVGGGFIDAIGDTNTADLFFPIITFPSAKDSSYIASKGGFLVFYGFFGLDPDGGGPHPTVDSVKVTQDVAVSSLMDAEGMLYTPYDTFNVIRQNITRYQTDSAFMLTGGNWSLISPLLQSFYGPAVFVDTIYSVRFWSDDSTTIAPVTEYEYNLATGDNVSDIAFNLAGKPAPPPDTTIDTTIGVAMQYELMLKVSPNPANTYTTVELGHANTATYSLYTLQGQLVETGVFNKPRDVLDVSALENGIYMLSIQNAKATETLRLVVD